MMMVNEPSDSSEVKVIKIQSLLYVAYIKSINAPTSQTIQENTLMPVESFTFSRCLIWGAYAERKINAPIKPRF